MSENIPPRVAILMGSDSDLPVMADAARVLRKVGVGHEMHVTSAHRSPQRTLDTIRAAENRGVQVFIVGAGHAAHLAGVVSAHTTRPVLGVPLASSDLHGLDSLLATVQMPAGIPVGTLAIGTAGAANAGWLATSILALQDDGLAQELRRQRDAMAAKVAEKDALAQERLKSMLED